jgi:hypothetical protein
VSRLLHRGCRGDDVADWQMALIGLGHDLGSMGADGDFGRLTDAATRAFQSARAIRVDGVVGPQTWASLHGVVVPPGDLPDTLEPGADWAAPLSLQPWPAGRIREALVASYWSCLGLAMHKGSPSRAAFLALVGPTWANGAPMNFDVKQQIWTCAMTFEGCLRRLRVDCDALLRPPKVAEAGSRSRVYAQQRRAWVVPNASTRPEPGDAYVVGPADCQHWRCLVGWEGDHAVTVDGGQVDAVFGRQCTKLKRNRWVKRWGVWCEEGSSQWHKTWAWYDAARLGWRDEPRLLPTA